MEAITEALSACTVNDADGKAITVGTLWEKQPLLLLFVRHFACLFCREEVKDLKPHFDEIRQAGTAIAIIGNGSTHFANAFRTELALDVPIYTDETRAAYAAASLTRSVGSMLHPGAGVALFRAWFKGSAPSLAVQGDAQQQGGTFVIRPPGEIVFHYRNRWSGDHAKVGDVVAAAVGARG